MSSTNTHTDTHTRDHGTTDRRISTETKASFKTTELIVFVAAVVGVLVASAIVDATDFGARSAWFYVTLLAIGYMISRGLAKSGSRAYYDDSVESSSHR